MAHYIIYGLISFYAHFPVRSCTYVPLAESEWLKNGFTALQLFPGGIGGYWCRLALFLYKVWLKHDFTALQGELVAYWCGFYSFISCIKYGILYVDIPWWLIA